MDITPLVPKDRKIIKSYGKGRFTIAGDIFENSVIVFPDRVLAWPVVTFNDMNENVFDPLIQAAGELDVVLIGTGKQFELLPRTLTVYLKKNGLKVEAMDTGAACRTYNVLLSEERRVAAALIAIN